MDRSLRFLFVTKRRTALRQSLSALTTLPNNSQFVPVHRCSCSCVNAAWRFGLVLIVIPGKIIGRDTFLKPSICVRMFVRERSAPASPIFTAVAVTPGALLTVLVGSAGMLGQAGGAGGFIFGKGDRGITAKDRDIHKAKTWIKAKGRSQKAKVSSEVTSAFCLLPSNLTRSVYCPPPPDRVGFAAGATGFLNIPLTSRVPRSR